MNSIEWLMQTLEQNNIIDLDIIDSDKYYTIIEQAKEMEKQQIIDAFKSGADDGCDEMLDGNEEQYYNETFGGAGEPGR